MALGFLSLALGPIAAAVAPVALELGGFVGRSYRIADGAFCILPRTFSYPATPTIVLLLAASAAMVVGATYYSSAYARLRHEAEQRLRLHVWQLGQLVRDDGPGDR